MADIGQIVEIPYNARIFSVQASSDISKLALLHQIALPKNYDLFDGFLVGAHDGLNHFKLGQRKGLNIGGKKAPLYVIGKDADNNRLFVGQGDDHPGLQSHVLRLKNNGQFLDSTLLHKANSEQGVKIGVQSPLYNNILSAHLYITSDSIFLEFDTKIKIALIDNPISIFLGDPKKEDIQLINI